MDFLKKHGEKVLLAAMLGLFTLSILLALGQAGNFEDARALTIGAPTGDFSLDVSLLDGVLSLLRDQPPVTEISTNTFTPGVRRPCRNLECRGLIPLDAKVCPYCDTGQTVGDPDSDLDTIPDRLELKWGMNPNDPSDVYRDLDGDGFPVLYEHHNNFDPIDPASHPPLIDYLRLGDVEETSIRFFLRGDAKLAGGFTLQLEWQYPDGSQPETEYIKTGTRFGRKEEFLAESFTEKSSLIDNRYIDQSFAIIRSGRHQLRLAREGDGRRGQITESIAEIKLVFGPVWSEQVRFGSEFVLDKKSYKVVDISKSAVVLETDGPEGVKQMITIGPATPEELEKFQKYRAPSASVPGTETNGGFEDPDHQWMFEN